MRIDALNRNWVKLALLNIVISVSVSLIVFLSLGKSEKQSATKQFQDQVTILHQEISKVRLLVFTILPVKISSCQPISQFCQVYHYINQKEVSYEKELQKMQNEFLERNSIEATKTSIATSTTPNPDQTSIAMVAKNTKLIKSKYYTQCCVIDVYRKTCNITRGLYSFSNT